MKKLAAKVDSQKLTRKSKAANELHTARRTKLLDVSANCVVAMPEEDSRWQSCDLLQADVARIDSGHIEMKSEITNNDNVNILQKQQQLKFLAKISHNKHIKVKTWQNTIACRQVGEITVKSMRTDRQKLNGRKKITVNTWVCVGVKCPLVEKSKVCCSPNYYWNAPPLFELGTAVLKKINVRYLWSWNFANSTNFILYLLYLFCSSWLTEIIFIAGFRS